MAAGERPVTARLVRFTVVDPDPILAEHAPQAGCVLEGVRVLPGADDRGFLLDLAPTIAEHLNRHNGIRAGIEYHDPESGEMRRLRPIRMGQLDVVVEVLKTYL